MRVCSSSFFLVRDPVAVPKSRRRLGQLIEQWGIRTDDGGRLALNTVVSELVTNAVRHTTGAMITVGVHANLDRRRLVIEVYDGSAAMPQRQEMGPDAEAGRGMFLVEHLALAHGVERTVRGKRVWAEVALPEQPVMRRQLLAAPCRVVRAALRTLPISKPAPIPPPRATAGSRPRHAA
jgi:anti-sigma regulatory factor (Ser/Thr protein kinase)